MGRSLVQLALLCASTALLTASPQAQAQNIIHESAVFGVGEGEVRAIDETQFLGSRFTVTEPVEVGAIGGNLSPGEGGTIFGAIIRLEDSTALPAGDPIDDAELVASTVFEVNAPGDLLTRLCVTLPAGDYALVFGSGLYGAATTPDGEAANMPQTNQDILGQASYFYWNGQHTDLVWVDGGIESLRFVVMDGCNPLDEILDGFDQAIPDTLQGNGPGNSANGRLGALRNMLEAAGNLIDAGDIPSACEQLDDALAKTDGLSPPPDFVKAGPEGNHPEVLAGQIEDLMDSLSCP